MLAAPTPTPQGRREDDIDQNPPPAYGAFAFHLIGDTQTSRPTSPLSESSSSMPLAPPSPLLSPLTTQEGTFGSSPDVQSLPTARTRPFPPLPLGLTAASAPQMPPTGPSQLSQSEQFLIEIDQDLVKVNRLLSELSVLTAEQESSSSSSSSLMVLPSRTPLATFRELDALELYHSNPQKCLSGLAKERQRLLKARQALRLQWIGIQAQTDRGESNNVTTSAINTSNAMTAEASSQSHSPARNSSSAQDDTSGPLSSASVALTVALYEASSERLSELHVIDKTISELCTLLRTLNVMYPQSVPRDLFASKLVFHLYQTDRATAIKGIYAELELQKKQRLELLKIHQDLHVQGLIAQMRCFK